MQPVDLFRRDGDTAYSHDVQVDDAGVAWVSGDGGTRGYWTDGRTTTRSSAATATPAAEAGAVRRRRPAARRWPRTRRRLRAQRRAPDRPRTPRGDDRYKRGESLLVTEEDFGPAAKAAAAGHVQHRLAEGQLQRRGLALDPAKPFRLEVVGTWNPFDQEGSRPAAPVPAVRGLLLGALLRRGREHS